jgi:hypothetical protein
MKTETWPMEYQFERPPRWDGGCQPTRVYLDHWCWDHLVRDRAGELSGSPDEGTYACFKRLAATGEVVFLLSQAHYRENWASTNEDARWDRAVVMAELTGFSTLNPFVLHDWDAEVAVALHFGMDAPGRPAPYGWGHGHCVRGVVEESASIVDVTTGAPPSPTSLGIDTTVLTSLEDECANRLELATLARRDPRLETALGMVPFDAVVSEAGGRFQEEQRRLADVFATYGRSPEMIRAAIEFQAFQESEAQLVRASSRLGISTVALFEDLADRTDHRAALHEFISRMPIQGPFTELRVRAHLKDSFRFTPSDMLDFWIIATVRPFVDIMVTDRRTYNLVNEIATKDCDAAHVVRRLADVRGLLTQDRPLSEPS